MALEAEGQPLPAPFREAVDTDEGRMSLFEAVDREAARQLVSYMDGNGSAEDKAAGLRLSVGRQR